MLHAPRTLVLICCLAALAGCAREEREVTSTGSSEWRAPPARGAPRQATSAANYVAAAAAIDLFVIRSSELALQHSARAQTRDFATHEITAHKGLASQLSFAGRRLNLLPSATLPPRY